MIKDALKYLVELGQVETVTVNGQEYSTGNLQHIKHPTADPLKVNTLSGITEYILSDFDKESFAGTMIHVQSPSTVSLVSSLFDDSQRETYMIAEAFKQGFAFGQFHNVENFIIGIQSCFVRNDDADRILKIVGNIKDEAVKTYGDDGVSQSVTAKTGIATVDEVRVPNPVILAPYRTFVEVAQPESSFVFRIKQGPNGPVCALFEADGGTWKLEAMARVKDFLEDKLEGTGTSVIS
jgi:hypothetical protein